MITLVELVAATFTTVSLFPQLVKSWGRIGSNETTDNKWLLETPLFCIGIFLWLGYGIHLKEIPRKLPQHGEFFNRLHYPDNSVE